MFSLLFKNLTFHSNLLANNSVFKLFILLNLLNNISYFLHVQDNEFDGFYFLVIHLLLFFISNSICLII